MKEITVNQELQLFISPKDSKGNTARIDGVPAWSVSDTSLIELVPGADEFEKVARPKGTIGAALITCTVDADLGEGVKNLVGQFTVTVLPGEASTLAISAGAATPLPAPAAEPVSTDTPAATEAITEVTADPVVTEVVADPVTVETQPEVPAADPVTADPVATEPAPVEAPAEAVTEPAAEPVAEPVAETPAEGGETPAG